MSILLPTGTDVSGDQPGAGGPLKPRSYTTSALAPLAAVLSGCIVWDSTLGKLVRSDGAAFTSVGGATPYFRAVADTTERDAIPTGERFPGMVAITFSQGAYSLVGGIGNGNWHPWPRINDLAKPASETQRLDAASSALLQIGSASLGLQLYKSSFETSFVLKGSGVALVRDFGDPTIVDVTEPIIKVNDGGDVGTLAMQLPGSFVVVQGATVPFSFITGGNLNISAPVTVQPGETYLLLPAGLNGDPWNLVNVTPSSGGSAAPTYSSVTRTSGSTSTLAITDDIITIFTSGAGQVDIDTIDATAKPNARVIYVQVLGDGFLPTGFNPFSFVSGVNIYNAAVSTSPTPTAHGSWYALVRATSGMVDYWTVVPLAAGDVDPAWWSVSDVFRAGLLTPLYYPVAAYTYGSWLTFTRTGLATGIKIYSYANAGGSIGTHDVILELWTEAGTVVATVTISVTADGEYIGTFASPFVVDATMLHKRYAVTFYDGHGFTYIGASAWGTAHPPYSGFANRQISPGLFYQTAAIKSASGHGAPDATDPTDYYPCDLIFKAA